MLHRISTLLAFSALSAFSAFAQVPQGHVVWFDKPVTDVAKEWERNSLPIGNGSIGASVLGKIDTECYTLNEKSLWMGGPNIKEGPAKYWDANKESAPVLKQIRRAFTEGNTDLVQQLTEDNFDGPTPYTNERFGCFTTLGQLHVATGLTPEHVTDYVRALSIDSAYTTVNFNHDGIHYERRSFISYPDNVMATRFTASQPGKQQLVISYEGNPEATGTTTPEGKDGLVFRGTLNNNGMAHVVRLRAIAKGGSVSYDQGKLRVANADEVLILLTADTDYAPNYNPDFNDPKAYVGVNPEATTAKWMKAAAKKRNPQDNFKNLFARHLKDYKNLYNRVVLNLCNSASDAKDLGNRQKTTRDLLKDYRANPTNHWLEETYFQFGRYLLIASSRPGNLPANLQGIWAYGVDGPWHIDYHNNINLQMNYWPALTCALQECQEPLTDFIHMQRKSGAVTAQKYFAARGWMTNISGNPFGFTSPLNDKDMSWNFNPVAGSWLATHLWEQYAFTRDLRFLADTAYPILKECADFCCDYLWQKPDGTLTAAPSTSPEHGPVDEGTTFTHAVIREVISEAILAAEALKVDNNDITTWHNTLTALAPYTLGRYGQLQEWSRDIDDPDDHHRHVNHLFGLHPGSSISPLTTPDLAEAARVVLNHRGDGATGWSMGWKLNQWARLHDGNHSYALFQNLLKDGTADNLWDMHPPFQIDGNFGGTAGVAEMLLQSHAQCLHLLPALPDAWSEGSVSGLRARGGFVVDIAWSQGRLSNVSIKSLAGEHCTLQYGEEKLDFDTLPGMSYNVSFYNGYLKMK